MDQVEQMTVIGLLAGRRECRFVGQHGLVVRVPLFNYCEVFVL